ncbi:MAG: peptidylprolyl isomerase, partial [Caulobacteraceae bacterium]
DQTVAEIGFIKSLPVMSQSMALGAMTKDQKVTAWALYCQGVMGMARDDDPGSGNSQFFLMRWPYPSLEKRYTAWGRVISGLDTVRAIKTGEPVEAPQDRMDTVRVLADIPEKDRPKVRVIDPKGPWFKAQIERVRAEKGADFTACDVDIPVEVK